MLVFLPVILVLVSAALVQIIGRSHSTTGTKWLILAATVMITWGANLVLRSRLPAPMVMNDWFPASGSTDQVIFALDSNSWLFSFALLSVLVGIVFTGTTRLDQKGNLAQWTETLLVTALGLITILANSPLAFILTWTLIDVIEIIVLLQINQESELRLQTTAVLGSRFIGTILVLLAMILANSSGSPLSLSQASGVPLTLLIVSAGLRLGVVPLHLPYTIDVPLRRNLGTLLRMVAPLTAFVLISRFPVISDISGWLLLVFGFSLVGAIFGAIKWFTARDEMEGRPYWLLGFSSLVMIALLHGHPESALSLGLIMVVVGSWIFLQAIHYKWLIYSLPIIILAMVGIPYSPSVTAISGLSTGPLQGLNVIVWVSMAFLTAGVVKHWVGVTGEKDDLESWMRIFYTTGMTLLVVAPWLTGFWYYSEWKSVKYWWVGVIVVFSLGIILIFVFSQKLRQKFNKSRFSGIKGPFHQVGLILDVFLHFNWFYRLIGFFIGLLQQVIGAFNSILEGEGGILWAMVFLALLISLIAVRKSG